MPMRNLFAIALVLMLGSNTHVARGNDAPAKVDNPLFVAWSKCEVGASVTCESNGPASDGKNVQAIGTDTLKDNNAASVKIDGSVKMGRHQMDEHTEIPAKLDPSDIKLAGEEDVTAIKTK